MSSCVKKHGPKTEKRTREHLLLSQIPGLIPTEIDAVIDTEDGQILQFVYSPRFEGVPWGTSLTNLFRRFSVTFGPSISKSSLRQAILAWGAAFAPFSDHSGYSRMIEYSNRTFNTIRTKSIATIDEADLFATFLLSLLSCIYDDITTFKIRLYGFVEVAKEVHRKKYEDEYHPYLSTFWPLARDMIFEGIRRFGTSLELRPLVVWFCRECNKTIGPQSLIRRADYLMDFFGFDSNREYAFSQSVWTYSRLLRVCFRATVYRQLTGKTNMDSAVASTVFELKADLRSTEALSIVTHISSVNSGRVERRGCFVDPRIDLLRFSLFVYRFCELLISLLEARTLIEGTLSDEAISAALALKDLARLEWLEWYDIPPFVFFPRSTAYWFTPRILWTAGLCLGKRQHVEGILAY